MRVVGCTRVKDGARWVRRWIEDMSRLCEFLCILDDGSTDGTAEILAEEARKRQNLFLRRQRGLPRDGGRDCYALYEMAGLLKPDWIFAPDIDEFVDPEDFDEVQTLVNCDREDVLGWSFPFFYFWDDERHYRADGDYANCHVIRLFRYDPNLRPARRISHSQLCPDELDRRRVRFAPARMVHYGYLDQADRAAKHLYYTQRDPDPMKAGGGVKNYDHILGVGAEIRPYPSRTEWLGKRIEVSTARRLLRLRASPSAMPGCLSLPDEELGRGDADEVVWDDFDMNRGRPSDLQRILASLRPGGRLDVNCLDFDRWVEDYAKALKAEDEEGKVALIGLLDGRIPIWEKRLGSALSRAGFERIERLPTKRLCMIAFAPHGRKEEAGA